MVTCRRLLLAAASSSFLAPVVMVRGWVSSASSNLELATNLRRNTDGMPDSVMRALAAVDRVNYCRRNSGVGAYEDRPQGISFGVTISAPHMHAHALTTLAPFILSNNRPSVLDVGSGSGYFSAVVAELIKQHEEGDGRSVGIEHIPELVEWSIENARRDGRDADLQSGRLVLLEGDGFAGYPPSAPYDAIHVGAAPPSVPQALLEQLKVGGCLLIPVGPDGGNQVFKKIVRTGADAFTEENLFGVRYVPLTTREAQLARSW